MRRSARLTSDPFVQWLLSFRPKWQAFLPEIMVSR
jgi:hypothetical protein